MNKDHGDDKFNNHHYDVIKIPKFDKLGKLVDYEFDYEVNSIKIDERDDELNCKMHFYDKKSRSYSKISLTARDCQL